MKTLRKAVITSLGILPLLTPIDFVMAESATELKDELRTKTTTMQDDLSSNAQELPWKKSRFILEAQTGSRTIGSVDAMVPFMGDNDFMVYANLKAKLGTGAKNKNGNTFEGNVGFGVRRINDSETAIYGAYAYYDYLRSVNDNTFHQITVGAERLGVTWDYRANVYLPIGTKEYNKVNLNKVVVDQHNLIQYLKSTSEKATTGGDIEVGRTLGSNKLRGYVAAYTFGKDLTGPRARIEYKLNNRFTLTGAVQYDKDRGTQYLMGARFSLGGVQAKNSNSIYNRMTDMVVRDLDIVTSAEVSEFTNTVYDKFWMVDLDSGIGGHGTQDSPFGNIDEAIEAAPDGAIIYVKGQSNEGALPFADTLTLGAGQTLWGGYLPLYYDFNNNRYVSTPVNDNSMQIMAGSGVRQTLGGSVHMADNSGIYNMDVAPSQYDANGNPLSSNGIIIDNKKNVTLDNVSITGFKADPSNSGIAGEAKTYSGVLIKGDSTANLNSVTVDNNDIGVLFENGTVTFNNLTATNATFHGIKQTGGNLTLNASNISNSGLNGVYTENATMVLNGGAITNNADNGVYANNSHVTITGTNIASNLQNGVHANNGSTVSITGATIDSNVLNGILLDNSSNLAELLNSTVSNNTQHGLQINNSQATINNSIFENNALESIEFASDLGDLTSAIQINDGGSLVANGLTVQNNAAGIELTEGTVSLDNSLIDANTGYGVWAHGNTANRSLLTLHVANSVISNTKKITNGALSGHGIFTDQVGDVSLNNLNILHNEGTGLWLRDSYGLNNSHINVIGSGSEVEHRNTLDDLSYGVRIEGNPRSTFITIDNLLIEGSYYHGLLVNDGTVTLSNFSSINNEDGVVLTAGELNITNGTIYGNKRYGIFAKRYIYGDTSDTRNRYLNLTNVTVSNTTVAEQGTNPAEYIGHGLAVDHYTLVTSVNSKFINNDGYGVWVKAGNIDISGDSQENAQISHNKLGGFNHNYLNGNKLSINIRNTAITDNKGIGLSISFLDSLKLDGLLITKNYTGAKIQPKFSEEVARENGYGISNSIIRDNYYDSNNPSRIEKTLDRGGNTFQDVVWY